MHFLVKIHFGLAFHVNVIFILSLEIQVIYIKRDVEVYMTSNVGNDVWRCNANFIYRMKFLNFYTIFGGTFKNENKIGKIFVFEVL